MAIDHEAFRSGEGDLAAGLARNLDRAAHGAAWLFRVPQIAFEIENARAGDELVVERGWRQELAGAEEGVHRALAIGRHEDEAPRGRGLAVARWRVEIDTDGADVVREHIAQLILGHLAHEGALRTQRAHACQRVRCRTARNFPRRAHRFVKPLRAVFVHQRHPALVQIELVDQFFGAGGHYVDDGIADGDHVVAGFGHGYSGRDFGMSGAVSGSSPARQGRR